MYINDNWMREIEYVVTHFDAERVEKVMDALDIRWYGYYGVPEQHEIKFELRNAIIATVRDMVKSGQECLFVVTRGFSIEVSRFFETEKLYIRVFFIVSESENYD